MNWNWHDVRYIGVTNMNYYIIHYGEFPDQDEIIVAAENYCEAVQECGIEDELIWSIEKLEISYER